MFGRLFVVATPIGNLGDVTIRAIDTLQSVDAILCEDTRVTHKLLELLKSRYPTIISHYPPLVSYHHHSNETKKLEILKMLIDGKDLALVTDAGTPGISDPGNELISYLLEKEPMIQIVPIAGPSSLTAALSVCGLDVSQFIFVGFMPKKRRNNLFTLVKDIGLPCVFYESPHRIGKTLDDLLDFFGDRQVVVCRELTKKFESLYRGNIREVMDRLEKDDSRGEIVVILSTK